MTCFYKIDQSPMTNRVPSCSRQRWRNNIFSILSTSPLAFPDHFLSPSTTTAFVWVRLMLQKHIYRSFRKGGDPPSASARRKREPLGGRRSQQRSQQRSPQRHHKRQDRHRQPRRTARRERHRTAAKARRAPGVLMCRRPCAYKSTRSSRRSRVWKRRGRMHWSQPAAMCLWTLYCSCRSDRVRVHGAPLGNV